MRVRVAMCRFDGNELDDDWRGRVALLRATIDAAFGRLLIPASDLHVFLAPEYFFRKGRFHDDRGITVRTTPSTYTAEEYKAILKALQELTSGRKLLLIPGTIFWLNRDVARNTAPIIFSGALQYLYHKHSNAAELCPADRRVASGQVSGRPGDEGFAAGAEAPYFELKIGRETYSAGIEVCADHAGGTLLAALGRSTLDFHFIVANPVSLEARHVAAMRGRYVMLCSAVVSRRARMAGGSLLVKRVESARGALQLVDVEQERLTDDYRVFRPFELGRLF